MNNAPQLPPEYFEAIAYQKKGQLVEAKNLFDAALKKTPNIMEIHNALAVIGHQAKNYDMALFYLKNCIRLQPNEKKHQYNYLHLSKELKRNEEALSFINEMLQKFPSNYEFLKEKASLECQLEIFSQAAETYEKLYSQTPENVEIATQLGFVYDKSGDFEKAKSFLEQHITKYAEQLTVRVNFAFLLNRRGEFDEAEKHLKAARDLAPDNQDILYNLANVLRHNQKYREALTINKRLIELNPDHPETHVHAAFCHLAMGELKEGWKEYEWRWKVRSFVEGTPPAPLWQGEETKDKTLLLLCEQGFGDAIQFVRYAKEIKKKCKKLIFYCRPDLFNLLGNLSFFDQVVTDFKTLEGCDYTLPIMSTPSFLGIDRIDDIPDTPPYLNTQKRLPEAFLNLLKTNQKTKIGVCWRGSANHINDSFRSIEFEQFKTLFNSENCQFISLQIPPANDKEHLPEDVLDAAPYIKDFEDTAAICKELDLILTVDTSLAHLCGAFGFPVWILISSNQDWRWFQEREDSPWYSSVRLIRNSHGKNWLNTLNETAKELAVFPTTDHS